MPICAICSEEVVSDADMRTHLLLSHLENDMSCPFCSLSGVSYDELSFHISTAHTETDCHSAKANGPGRSRDRTRHGHNTKDGKEGLRFHNCSEGTASGPSEGSSANRLNTKASEVSPGPSKLSTSLSQDGGMESPHAGTTPTQGSVPGAWSAPTVGATTTRVRATQGSSRLRDSAEDTQGNTEEHVKCKQKRLSSPRKEGKYPCPICAVVCSDCFILQEHVELHLQGDAVAEGALLGAETSAGTSSSSGSSSGVKRYDCPLCAAVCADSTSLQEHVELHLDYGTVTGAESSSSDLMLARQLQEEEEQKRKEQEAEREAEEFKKLQRQFGLDGSGGYRRQMERTMERAVSRGQMVPVEFHRKRAEMLESLASGVDDGRTRTPGLISALYEHYQREARDSAHVWLCAETDHYSSSEGDKGWGCGYRNFQMLLSALQRMEQYTSCFSDGSVPSIPRVQALIEEAWRGGLDPQGASHFNHRLQGSRAWIGATEIYALLTSLRVKARMVDFHKPTGPGDTHPRLFEWVKRYFSLSASRSARLPPRVVRTAQPPIYLQHQGHSRSIVGVEQKKDGGLCLLIFDPGCGPGEARKLLARDTAAASARRMRKFPGNLKQRQYQVVTAEGVLTPEEGRSRVLNSRTLQAERIP